MDLPGKGKKNRFCGGNGAGEDRNRRDRVMRWKERILGEATGMGGAIQGQGRNLAQQKLSKDLLG